MLFHRLTVASHNFVRLWSAIIKPQGVAVELTNHKSPAILINFGLSYVTARLLKGRIISGDESREPQTLSVLSTHFRGQRGKPSTEHLAKNLSAEKDLASVVSASFAVTQ